MILFHTLTADARVLAIHQTLNAARDFAKTWNVTEAANILNRPKGAERYAARIASAKRGGDVIVGKSDKFNAAKAIEHFTL